MPRDRQKRPVAGQNAAQGVRALLELAHSPHLQEHLLDGKLLSLGRGHGCIKVYEPVQVFISDTLADDAQRLDLVPEIIRICQMLGQRAVGPGRVSEVVSDHVPVDGFGRPADQPPDDGYGHVVFTDDVPEGARRPDVTGQDLLGLRVHEISDAVLLRELPGRYRRPDGRGLLLRLERVEVTRHARLNEGGQVRELPLIHERSDDVPVGRVDPNHEDSSAGFRSALAAASNDSSDQSGREHGREQSNVSLMQIHSLSLFDVAQ